MREAQRDGRAARLSGLAAALRRDACAPSSSAHPSSPPRCSSGWRERSPPALVLTPPRPPAGPRSPAGAPPVAERARALGLALEQPESVNEPQARELIAQARPEAVVVCAFGALIKEPLLSEHELLNVHPSLLPRWRGAAPIERAIMAGDEHTGVSIMRLTAGLDSGPVCLTSARADRPAGHYGSLAARLQELGGELLVRTLDLLASGRIAGVCRAGRGGRHLRREDRPRGPPARPGSTRGRAGAHRARAAPAHRRAGRARGRDAARRAPRA